MNKTYCDMELIDKSKVVAELEKFMYEANQEADIASTGECFDEKVADAKYQLCKQIRDSIDPLEVKEVNIADMADDYYDALMKEADWMDEGTMGHCRLAYYNGCKDVLNIIQKGE